jgi:hypothetical protein
MREPNAIDFWRGFALITIFINHVPGNVFEPFTYSKYSLSDAAELFVFLAGWAIALATHGREGPDTPGRVLMRLASRTLEVYRAQLVITAIALAMIAASALYFNNPLFLEWHNAAPAFTDPIQTTIGWVILTHQLGYFNILPLYVALLALSPMFVLLARVSRVGALCLSLAIYLSALVLEFNLPTWPVEGTWFFNPFAWQLLLALGFLGCLWSRESASFRRWAARLMPIALIGVAAGVIVAAWDLKPDPLLVPEPRLLFTFDKSNLSPGRLLHFIAVVVGFQSLYGIVAPYIPWLARQLSALGRNSLAVFSVGSIVSLAAQLLRFELGGGFVVDVFIVGSGLACLIFSAWFVEWRLRSSRPSSLST